MNKFDFSTIDHQEFEELARDILNRVLNIDLRSYKPGKDKGIDLKLASEKNTNEIVVQAKHYLKSGFDLLLSKIEKEEKPKVDKLLPGKFIVVTSVSLSENDKAKIKTALEPHVKTTDDVYGQEDLNKYLSNNEDIVRKHYKLWLTSTSVLRIILNNAVNGRSKFIKQKIQKNIALFVKNKAYKKATDILEANRFILITGLPGVGKTILSYILICELLSKDYQLVYIDQDIKEAENNFDEDETVKQIFLLDDFLGANYHEIINPKSTHSSVRDFIDRIRTSRNKYCILTTRTNILNKTKLLSEKLANSEIDIGKMELEIKDYETDDKGHILYNHLLHNDLPIEYIDQIFKDKNYWKIINHTNYNPRLIEFITSKNILKQVTGTKTYLDCVLFNLDHPSEIWAHAFENQIEKDDQFFIYTIFTFGNKIELLFLEQAFNRRIAFEVSNNGYQVNNNSFNNSIKRLADGFISSHRLDDKVFFQFINPSVNDFLINYFGNSREERLKLINSCSFYSQFGRLITLYNHYKKDKSLYFEDEWILLIKQIAFVGTNMSFEDLTAIPPDDDCRRIMVCNLLFRMSYWALGESESRIAIDNITINLLGKTDIDSVLDWDFELVISLLNTTCSFGKSYEFIKGFFIPIIDKIVKNIHTYDQIRDVKSAFEMFEMDWSDYLLEHIDSREIKNNFEEIISENVKEFISDEKNTVLDRGDLQRLKERAEKEWYSYLEDLDLDIDFDVSRLFSNLDEVDLMMENDMRRGEEIFDRDGDKESTPVRNINQEVDDLFSRRAFY